jgi:UDP-2-acetamido-3-amino-2,3-dideoxy-glucuronate N-acetyltransferase|tara:strand:+ start:166 stop:1149 length:984 start_codon:yes stop_codon:yes gene_type:complete
MKKLGKICVIGAGKWGKNHVRTLYQLGELGGVVDSNKKALNQIKRKYPSIPLFSKVSEVTKLREYSGYIISTPANTHFEIAMEVMTHGNHVLIEKPVALTSIEVQNMKKFADKVNVNLMAGHVLLFHPAIRKIKDMILNNIIGDLQYIYSNRLNLGTVRTEENVFWSLAPHDISVFQYFTESKPLKISSTGGIFLQENIHDTTLTILEYDRNIKGHIFVSWLHPFKEHRLIVMGSKGMISFEDSADNKPLKLYSKGYSMDDTILTKHDGAVDIIKYENLEPLKEELKYFIDHLDGSPLSIANADSAIEVVEILTKASESLMKGVIIE